MLEYQKKHYEAVKVDDIEDPDALISINADSQAFYVLNQGKEIVRTRNQLKEKRAKEQEERDKKKRDQEDKKKTLELEQVEDLKEKLTQHMVEIRRLFSAGANGGSTEDDRDNLLGEDDGDALRQQRLLDQIIKLKMIIN